MAGMERKSFDSPDETRAFDKGKADIVKFGGVTIGRITAEPGWSWSECVKPIVKTESCQVHHTGMVVSGRLKVVMNDGAEQVFGPGDAYVIPPGHDATVDGNEAVVAYDFTGATDYAKR